MIRFRGKCRRRLKYNSTTHNCTVIAKVRAKSSFELASTFAILDLSFASLFSCQIDTGGKSFQSVYAINKVAVGDKITLITTGFGE